MTTGTNGDLALERRKLGRTGVEVTALGFGGATIGINPSVTEAQAQETLHAAWDAGLRYFDTAPWYGRGLSELRVGQLLRGLPRDQFVLSTKVGRILRAPVNPLRARPADPIGWPAVRGALRLLPRWDPARLRGLPATAWPGADRSRHRPRPRPWLPRAAVALGCTDGPADHRWLAGARGTALGRAHPRDRRRHQSARYDPTLPRPVRPRLLPAGRALHPDGAGDADRRTPGLRRARRRHRDRGRLQLGHRGDWAGAGRRATTTARPRRPNSTKPRASRPSVSATASRWPPPPCNSRWPIPPWPRSFPARLRPSRSNSTWQPSATPSRPTSGANSRLSACSARTRRRRRDFTTASVGTNERLACCGRCEK